MKPTTLALLTLLMVVMPVYGDECMNGAISNLEMRECAGQQLVKADKALNQIYQKLLKFHSQPDDEKFPDLEPYHATRKAALIKAELSWIKYRDAQCNYQLTRWGNGHEGRAFHITCLTYMTEDRVKELQSLLKEYQEY